jgi:sigma-B regulation protein RsbU (phosphoserine phosphatase)
MVMTKTLIEDYSSCKSPQKVFENVNKKLLENNEDGMFVTAFIGFYNIPTGKFLYANAGHNPPLLKKKGKTFEFLRNKPCTVLAWMENVKYTENEIILESGDILYLYTDGVTEAMNPDKELFSEKRLIAALDKNSNSSTKNLIDSVKLEIDNYRNGAEQADDITMLALKINNVGTGKKLTVEAKKENLNTVMGFVSRELGALKYRAEFINEIEVSTEEIFMNIVNYAYSPENGEVEIDICTTDNITIKFEDSGRPYNPLEQAAPDLGKSPVDRNIGGLGIYLVKKMMDTVEYSRVDNKNILVITKNHPSSPHKTC